MKKAIFSGLAALFLLAALSCEIDEKSGGYITLNGPEISGGRALDGPIAEAVTNFYEATFQKVLNGGTDGAIIRTTWNYAQRGKIQIEPGTYTVILMAGRSVGTDKILLGVGKVSEIGEGGGSTPVYPNMLQVTITADTTYLDFTAYPLMNDINGRGDSSTTFTTELSDGTSTLDTEEDEFGNDVPVFMITRGGTTTATWKFGIGDLPDGSYNQIDVFGLYILVTGDPDYFLLVDAFSPNGGTPSSNDKLDAKSFIGPDVDNDISEGTFEMSFTAPNTTGMVQISLNVPVVAIKNSSDKPVIWYIRGGLNNRVIDVGAANPGAVGGAIVLGF